ncbi:hypothetical protein [Ideonella sp. YS5]|uniref:hypothetical protein n=1 Tax=Ideonella sp. YS5 TaxID=3453714 RepID=UPI003EED6F98
MDQLLTVLGNSHFEAWVAGPLLGVIMGAVFAGLGKRPGGASPSDVSPSKAREDLEDSAPRSSGSGRQVHHHHYHHGRPNDSDPSWVIAVLLALGVALFLFAAYLPEISDTLCISIATVSTFAVTAAAVALLSGRFNTVDWWVHAVAPALTLVACLWVTTIARNAVSDDVVHYAKGLLASQPGSVGGVIKGAMTFFRAIKSEYVQWMLFDMLAFVLLFASTILCALQCSYYVSLANVRDGGGSFWQHIARMTTPFGGLPTLGGAGVLLFAAWALASGEVYQLTR